MPYGVPLILGLSFLLQELRGELWRVSQAALPVDEKRGIVRVGCKLPSGI